MTQAPPLVYVQLKLPLQPQVQEGSPEHRMLVANMEYILPWVMEMQALCMTRRGELKLAFKAGRVYYQEQLLKG